MKKYILSLVLLPFLFCACTRRNDKVLNTISIDLNGERMPRSEIESYLEMTGLSPVTYENVFLTLCKKSIIRDSLVYVLDMMQPTIFRLNLKTMRLSSFLNKIGHANNEYLSITDFNVDSEGNVLVYDSNSEKINCYDANGIFLSSQKAPVGECFAVSKNGEIAVNCGRINEKYLAVVYSREGEMMNSIPSDENAKFPTPGGTGAITPFHKGFVFTTPYDYSMQTIDKKGSGQLVSFDFGSKTFDASQLRGMDYPQFLELMKTSHDKVMQLHMLSTCGNMIFYSTDIGDQLLYDAAEGRILHLSRSESPYNILFSSALSVNQEGQFCALLSGSNIINGLIPLIEKKPTGNHVIDEALEYKDNPAETWILLGKIKRK